MSKTKCMLNILSHSKLFHQLPFHRWLSTGSVKCGINKDDTGCHLAHSDRAPEQDPKCPRECKRWVPKKKNILHQIKLKILEGGSNFGTPYRMLRAPFKFDDCEEKKLEDVDEEAKKKSKAIVETKKTYVKPQRPRGVKVALLGIDTTVGQYVALLLKQCSCISQLRLFELTNKCPRDVCQVVQDLQHIDTSCSVSAYKYTYYELERCIQNSDIVLLLESPCVTQTMDEEKRFNTQAPLLRTYIEAVVSASPTAFVIVALSPIDCMVPLAAQTLKDYGWYNPSKLLGSLAVPEMRASTLAARSLGLEPQMCYVPCVGGTEGDALVPLFSRAIEYFDFSESNALLLTETVRSASEAVTRNEGRCPKCAELSEAHALAKLVTKVAQAQLCLDVPRLTGFIETHPACVVSPTKYSAIQIQCDTSGISKRFGFPPGMSPHELYMTEVAMEELSRKLMMVHQWHFDDYRRHYSSFGVNLFTPHIVDPRVHKCSGQLVT